MPFDDPVTTQESLRELYRQPHEFVLRKQIDHIDTAARSLIAALPLVVLATAHADGDDVSPRGGPPGFVKGLDEHRLAFGDLSGREPARQPHQPPGPTAGRPLFVVPGVDETLRVNGSATLTTHRSVLEATTIDDKLPRAAVGIDVDE